MSEYRKRRDELIKEYLQRNDGDVQAAIEDLRKAYKALPTPVLAFEALAYLNARSYLEDTLKNPDVKITCSNICRMRCKRCGEVLEYENKATLDRSDDILFCSCKKTILDPSAIFYRIVGNPDDYEVLSEEQKKE